MKYFFWNTNKKTINNYIKELIIENQYDIVALAEYEDNINELIDDLKKNKIKMYKIINPGCKRITLITKVKPKYIKSFSESEYYTIKMINLPYDRKQIIAVVHLPSRMHNNDEDRRVEIEALVKDIEEYEEKYNTKDTVIVGDFNANPFDKCMISVGGLHALLSSSEACREKRKVRNKTYSMFYNPMWNKFGDFEEPPGTYYYKASTAIEFFWHMFDQVIIRPHIIRLFSKESLKIITEINGKMLTKNNRIIISDHLPIEFIIKEE
ncbi:endonuclease/exonuclease/phosphatase family protein [Clostridium sporogenes]|uniref:endonuclease/exonuclease/phosphatase family protein n=1 Tax=Clostridium sporogenes TaxID=1509 RepID=UPI002237B902|nr:endonuclease/exonuclease/phosphatase family protein [Clostridium sporogenes]MCW6088844.1 endonuclease/exonuclease/phosphatase family protein [Clostridium sporogenes]